MDPDPQKPRALPSYLANGSSPLHMSQETRDKKERENLYAAIESSSSRGRQPVDLDAPNFYAAHQPHPTYPKNSFPKHRILPTNLEEEHARDPRDEAISHTPLAMSRAQSPYTQHPTIDFDGLSWPSKQCGDALHVQKLIGI